jgi:hypothetical protein
MKTRTSSPLRWAAIAALLTAASAATSGCKTEAFCFDDCGEGGSSTSSGVGQGGDIGFGGNGGDCLIDCVGGAGGTACVPTENPTEVCDGLDNDCDGQVDNVDFSQPQNCGDCATNCLLLAKNCEFAGTECVPSDNPGVEPGACKCNDCADDYYDLDGDGVSCEYHCVKTANDDSVCDNKDNDCDGPIDEDVDFCGPQNCGACGKVCAFIHATGQCTKTGPGNCGADNTTCSFVCDCPDPTDAQNCWWDANGLNNDGCEYPCAPTGVEVCDGIDNDCDGLIDGLDDLAADPAIGVVCHGDPDGLCGTVAHAGVTTCQAGVPVCTGPNVLHENEQLEVCNLVDDDCDGLVDDFPIDAGDACGNFSIFPCAQGTYQCQAGQLVCVGAIDPTTESCNGVDDDCDGQIDKTGNSPPADSIGPCNVPPPAPPGATQPCQPGTKACFGGSIVCLSSVGPTSNIDTCGDDSNCDGSLDNQPDLTSDVANCGSCGNDCYAGAVHSTWACVNGSCVFQGCQSGYVDLNADDQCEYPCTFVQPQETCNGVDDNCNGQIDEGVIAPSPTQVCGVNPAANRPECTSQVSVACTNGSWQCTFPANVCPGGCSANDEICDGLDNDCDGALNENVPNYNQPCASDDAVPVPGDGACRTTGTYICNGSGATICSATKANCANLPGGCTEVCDGIDNDCDGSTDESYLAKGSNTTFFVKPAVTRVANAGRWIMSYEASRPTATSTTPGTGNGYHTSAPVGVTLDKTLACSVQGKIPWFNVTPDEVEQTCAALGGAICTGDIAGGSCPTGDGDWERGCGKAFGCSWGYAPIGQCTSTFTASKYCNLGHTYDFDVAAGNQDGLLPTGSNLLMNCYADLTGSFQNTVATGKVFDITGNLREITKRACPSVVGANEYPLMGGSFLSQDENGSTCSYDFYVVDKNFKFYDTGFRCCFSQDPTL